MNVLIDGGYRGRTNRSMMKEFAVENTFPITKNPIPGIKPRGIIPSPSNLSRHQGAQEKRFGGRKERKTGDITMRARYRKKKKTS